MISTARQTKMLLPGEKTRCVMLDVNGVRARLPGHDEDDVLALIEQDGLLPWAWNIATREGANHAREIRVLANCVEHYAATGKRIKVSWRAVLDEIFLGCAKPWITGKDARLILSCSATQVSNLLDAKELLELSGTIRTTGPNGSALISCDSFVAFLTRRFVIQPHEVES